MALFSFHLVRKARYPRRIVQGAADYMGSVDASHRQQGHEANGVGHSIMFEEIFASLGAWPCIF
jgi:hypothetical protein